jgi:hypothetical protein
VRSPRRPSPRTELLGDQALDVADLDDGPIERHALLLKRVLELEVYSAAHDARLAS